MTALMTFWNVKGISPTGRETAKAAAKASGISLAGWLERAIMLEAGATMAATTAATAVPETAAQTASRTDEDEYVVAPETATAEPPPAGTDEDDAFGADAITAAAPAAAAPAVATDGHREAETGEPVSTTESTVAALAIRLIAGQSQLRRTIGPLRDSVEALSQRLDTIEATQTKFEEPPLSPVLGPPPQANDLEAPILAEPLPSRTARRTARRIERAGMTPIPPRHSNRWLSGAAAATFLLAIAGSAAWLSGARPPVTIGLAPQLEPTKIAAIERSAVVLPIQLEPLGTPSTGPATTGDPASTTTPASNRDSATAIAGTADAPASAGAAAGPRDLVTVVRPDGATAVIATPAPALADPATAAPETAAPADDLTALGDTELLEILPAAGPTPPVDAPSAAADDLRERLQRLAASGDLNAQYDLAVLYLRGSEVERDYTAAALWLERAAQNGLAQAQYNLGVMLDQGLGLAADPAAAASWFTLAAGQGHARAQYAIAIAHAEGRGVNRDITAASDWLKEAAGQGLGDAQYALGVIREEGLGGPADLAEAYYWYREAAVTGVGDAADRVQAIEPGLTAVQWRAIANNAYAPASLLPASSTSDGDPTLIREIQQLLQVAGFEPGPADGRLGDRTRVAIRAYQAAAGLPVDGLPSSEMLLHLRETADILPAGGR